MVLVLWYFVGFQKTIIINIKINNKNNNSNQMELENRYSDIDLCWRFIIPSPTPLHLGVCMCNCWFDVERIAWNRSFRFSAKISATVHNSLIYSMNYWTKFNCFSPSDLDAFKLKTKLMHDFDDASFRPIQSYTT